MEEAVKEREFYRYYHQSQRPRTHTPGVESVLAVPSSSTPPSPPPSSTELHSPLPSDDTALTAFAQLGALRLNARRCMISFFDRKTCYILAEATKTLSLQTGQAQFEEDNLAWGTTKLPRSESICRYTVKLPVKRLGQQPDDQSAFVVKDLSCDDRFSACPFVVSSPHSRFYAGVPIRSPRGHNIGTYCVMDEKPRDGLSSFELSFLEDMAVTVMRHLQMTRATDDHRRGGIMVRSLGSFAEGKSSLEDWWQDPWEPEPMSDTTVTFPDTASAPRQGRPTTSSGRVYSQESIMLSRTDSVNSSIPSVTTPNPTSPSSGPPGSVITPISDVVPEPRIVEVTTKTASSTKDAPHQNQYSPEIQATFSRAANMILEATEAEGAVFFDAKVSTFGGLVDDEFAPEQPELSDQGKPCGVLGSALWGNGIDLPTSSNVQYSMLESLLRHLVRTYPHGQIFNFDQDFVALPSTHIIREIIEPGPLVDAPSLAVSRKLDSSKSQDDENLLREVFPKARSLVLYPLWNAHRDRWFAGSIIWTSDPMRVFTSEQELSYLAAFSNSIMAEVARLDTQLADAAKADFISSISHELRSPLHGILGTTELLRDTHIDPQQSSMAQTIETCGKTLLDTINHVLDFAKINNLTRGASKRSKKRSQGAKQVINPGQGHTNDIMTLISDVDLSILTEEVLETVFAGYNFQNTVTQTLTETFDKTPKKADVPQIAVIVDINKTDNYVFRTQPGAWRRVLMNLFGNALKYTPAGYIKIKLQVTPSTSSDELPELRFIITDSGIGMSEEYVNNRLFHSFAQENSLSQGTGLGLSIVKQIVESLGGDVEVRSEKGQGTKFTVYCPLKQSIMSPAVHASTELLSISKRTNGLNVCFVGFDDEGDYFPVKSLKSKNATRIMIKALDNLCTDWFGMNVQKYDGKNAQAPGLFMATESGAKWLRAQYSKNPNSASTAPVIVVCQGAASAQSTTAITVPGQIFECIAQPCGPHKLGKALTSCLDRHAKRFSEQPTGPDSKLPNISQLSLQENTPPLSPTSVGSLLEAPRPNFVSTLSAPELHSVNSSPIKKTVVPHRALHCLAVDDNPINLRLLRMFIEKLSHKHTLATNGLEALEIFKTSSAPSLLPSTSPDQPLAQIPTPSRLDVVLMDINMPEMDGLEATRQIRAHERDNGLQPVTIIALTGVASSEAQQEAHVSGVNLFMIKPVRLADLDVVLKGVVTGQERVTEV